MQAGILKLRPDDLGILLDIAADDTNPDWLISRAVALLRASAGDNDEQIAQQIGVDPRTVWLWRNAYATDGFAGVFHDWPRPEPVVEPDAELDRDMPGVDNDANVRPAEPDRWLRYDPDRREYLRERREALGTRRQRPRDWHLIVE